ncbi:HD-GYP domain-containing protein [Chloroflexota bacterium]
MSVVCNRQRKTPSSSNQEVEEKVRQIRQSFLNAITSLVFALEAKNKYTSGHSQGVTKIAVLIAKELGMPQHRIEQIRIAASVHDIGKVGVSDIVLSKRGSLTDEEFMHIASHCSVGESILRPIIDDKEILQMVKHHHEKYDGTGYPDGLQARNIPIGARILAVADAYDAMTSLRSYRKALNDVITCAELKKNAGTQFDPIVVNTFIKARHRMIRNGQTAD